MSKIAKDDFINLVDKTTIAQLGALLANCKALISVDTGTMHLGLADRMYLQFVLILYSYKSTFRRMGS